MFILFADEPEVLLLSHSYDKTIVGICISFGTLLIIVVLVLLFVCLTARKKKITIVAQKSFIIKKKIILERPDSDKSNDSIAPLVKIDYQPMQVDLPPDQLNGSTSIYELPLDPEWEFPRERFV